MALVDYNYNFLYVNIGAPGKYKHNKILNTMIIDQFSNSLFLGSASDGGVYRTSPLYSKLHEQTNPLQIPGDKPIHPSRYLEMPYCIIGDDAFGSTRRLMKPIPRKNLSASERIFNYRLSRARRIVENTFGIASAQWRCMRTTLEQHPENAKIIVTTICILHNFLLSKSRDLYAPNDLIEQCSNEEPAENEIDAVVIDEDEPQSLAYNRQFNEQRIKEYSEFFMSTHGELAFQYRHI